MKQLKKRDKELLKREEKLIKQLNKIEDKLNQNMIRNKPEMNKQNQICLKNFKKKRNK